MLLRGAPLTPPPHRVCRRYHVPQSTTPTSWVSDRVFLRGATVVLWATVVITGLGMELVIGEPLVAYMGNNAGTMQFWKASQLFFSLSISVALFSQSPFGLPWAVIGFCAMQCLKPRSSCLLFALLTSAVSEPCVDREVWVP